MIKGKNICRNMTVYALLILMIIVLYTVVMDKTSMVQAATGYPDSLVGHMHYLAEQDYMFLDVSNMRQQQDGIGPSWNKASALYYRNTTKGGKWCPSTMSTAEGISAEERKMIGELRQSNIYCFKITGEDTDLLEFSYSNDDSLNKEHYYRTAVYKAGDAKGNLYAYLASYTVKTGDNAGKKAYMIGKVKLPEMEKQETEEESEEETDLTVKEQEAKNGSASEEEDSQEQEVNEEEIQADLTVEEQTVKNDDSGIMSVDDTTSYTVAELRAIQELLDGGYTLIDTSNMTTDWSSNVYYAVQNVSGFNYPLSSGNANLLKSKKIFCFDLRSLAATQEVIFTCSTDWNNIINNNNFKRTELYSVAYLRKGYLYTKSGTTTIGNYQGYTLGSATLEKSPLSGKTVYFDTGTAATNPKIKLAYADGVTEEIELKLSYNQTNVYEYTFPDYVLPNTKCQFSINGTSYVPNPAFENRKNSTPCYDLKTDTWKAFTPEKSEVSIRIKHDFAGAMVGSVSNGRGATVVYVKKDGTVVNSYDIGKNSNIIIFDLNSSEYDGFYIEEAGTSDKGNSTVITYREDVEQELAKIDNDAQEKKRLKATVDGTWTANTPRVLHFSEYDNKSDNSLNIPTGTFTKESDTFYAKATFYDYYSDWEFLGNKRTTYTGTNPNSVEVRVQANMFNTAVGEYFKEKGADFPQDGSQSPLYFGDFYDFATSELNGYDIGKNYYEFVYKNNNGNINFVPGSTEIRAPRQGLVNDKLVGNKVVMGINNVEVPYFNEEFLRGDNYYNDNLGFVFNDVEFPFLLNKEDGYWEFDSYNSEQSLRMKKDTSKNKYFLDRTGTAGAVKGAVVGYPTTNSNFFPFNDATESGDDLHLNYGYGAKIEIPFFMTSDGKVDVTTTKTDGTIVEEKKDIEFNFRGDDDIWIFIDDELILDIGGDHAAVSGTINFAKHAAVVTGIEDNIYDADVQAGYTKSFDAITPSEKHVLTLYYMERGIWESNMKVSFNFPQSNKLELEKEVVVPEGVNELFAPAIEVLKEKVPFTISVDNMATSGISYSLEAENKPVEKVFDLINKGETKVSWAPGAPPSQHDYIGVLDNMAERNDVVQYKMTTQKSDSADQSVTDARSAIINYYGTDGASTILNIDTDQIKNGGYIQFDAYLDYQTAGTPFVALIDADGDRIGGWVSGLTYTGGEASMKPKAWTTIKVDIAKMAAAKVDLDYRLDGTTANGDFDFDKVKQLQFAHWAPERVYIDNIYIKAPAVYGSTAGFTKDQDKIPDYGSIEAKKLMPITSAEYVLNPVVDASGNTYSYVDGGKIYLKHNDLAMFTDQFRRESYLAIKEESNQEIFDTTWKIFEEGVLQQEGTGTEVDDGRTENSPQNSGVKKPSEKTILFKSYSSEYAEDQTHFYDLSVKYTNTLKLGSIKIQKKVKDGQENLVDTNVPYKIRVSFSDIAGMALEGTNYGAYEKTEDVYLEATGITGEDDAIVITGIPAGTTYRIEELLTDDQGNIRDDFAIVDMTSEGTQGDGKDTGVYDEEGMAYQGTVVADTGDEIIDVITITNDLNPLTTLTGQKIWEVEEGNTAPDPAPMGVKLKLQRRFIAADGTNETYVYEDVLDESSKIIEFTVTNEATTASVDCKDGNKLTIETATDYKYSIAGLPLYGVVKINNVNCRRKYEYRLVETAIIRGDTEKTVVELTTSNDMAGSEADTKTGYQVTGGEAVTDGEGNVSYDITNTYNPETNLQITKVSGNDTSNLMEGVTFRLEKLIKNNEGDLVEDTSFNGGNDRDATTNGSGEITFLNLQDGFYRLTEIKTISGHSLLASPINISISRLNGSIASVNNEQYTLEITENTISLTISNQGLLELPMTGSNKRKVVIILGICLAVGGEGLYLWNLQSYRKHRRRCRGR